MYVYMYIYVTQIWFQKIVFYIYENVQKTCLFTQFSIYFSLVYINGICNIRSTITTTIRLNNHFQFQCIESREALIYTVPFEARAI